jgi:hypothetical protein
MERETLSQRVRTWWLYRDEIPSTITNWSFWSYLPGDVAKLGDEIWMRVCNPNNWFKSRRALRAEAAHRAAVLRVLDEVLQGFGAVPAPDWIAHAAPITKAALDEAVERMRAEGIDVVRLEPTPGANGARTSPASHDLLVRRSRQPVATPTAHDVAELYRRKLAGEA